MSAAKLFLVAVPLRIRLVSKTIWFVIGLDQCRPRSTTSKPAMQSKSVLFNGVHSKKRLGKKNDQRC
ncbi:hypothetical protein [Lapidilactobacillus wuchangensis]|uniref:hypothetical protein n=1 Tax=Lapidilactobacillus wuchangensis TaxID=2486001 RepID=UPI0013DE54AF|nr:hypothetical protein [Lapidilactobacillus wuchangensis]